MEKLSNREKFGYVKVAAAIPIVKVADVDYNVEQIENLIKQACDNGVDIVVFPELSVTGYTCQDLFLQDALIKKAKEGIDKIHKYIMNLYNNIYAIVGFPRVESGLLYNSAAILSQSYQSEYVDKYYLPNYKEFYERRWFSSGSGEPKIYDCNAEDNDYNFKFGVEICEDVWSPNPPSSKLAMEGADIIFNLSASNEVIGKHDYLRGMLQYQSARQICGYVYAGAGYGESSQDAVYAGPGFIIENGKILKETTLFSGKSQLIISDIDVQSLRNERLTNKTFADSIIPVEEENHGYLKIEHNDDSNYRPQRIYNAHPFVPGTKESLNKHCREILNIQALGLARKIDDTGMNPVIGVSGGSDSTWALLVIEEAKKLCHNRNIVTIGVTMPGFATSKQTYENSRKLINSLCEIRKTLDIKEVCKKELELLGHDPDNQDVTFENVQARQRTELLMNISNSEHGFVVGTGDLSELALGWCTYNADQMSMYGVNAGIPKTLVKSLIGWYADEVLKYPADKILIETLHDILNTPVSPELTGTGATTGKDAQNTESLIGPYELHDFFLYNMIRHGFSPDKLLYISEYSDLAKKYTLSERKKWLKVFITRFFKQQFKRNNLPDGPKIGSISLSQRGDWRMPSGASEKLWIDLIDNFNL